MVCLLKICNLKAFNYEFNTSIFLKLGIEYLQYTVEWRPTEQWDWSQDEITQVLSVDAVYFVVSGAFVLFAANDLV